MAIPKDLTRVFLSVFFILLEVESSEAAFRSRKIRKQKEDFQANIYFLFSLRAIVMLRFFNKKAIKINGKCHKCHNK